jgi:hypothetical protein
MSRLTELRRVGVVAVLGGLLLTAGSLALAQRASAAWYPVDEVGQPGRLVLTTDQSTERMLVVRDDAPTYWQVDAMLDSGDSGALSLAVMKTGELVTLPQGLRVLVSTCETEWTNVSVLPECTSGRVDVLDVTPAQDYTESSPEWQLGRISGSEPAHLLVTLSLPPAAIDDPLIEYAQGELGLRLTAIGDAPVPPAPDGDGSAAAGVGGGLAMTGADVLAMLTAGLGLAGLGISMTMHRKRTR